MSERCPICDGPTKTAPSGVIQMGPVRVARGPIEMLVALQEYGHRQPHTAGLDEQAIRADAAREERERVVAFLNAGADDGVALLNGDGSALDDGIRKIASVLRAVAEHIANGAHTAALRGGTDNTDG